MCSISSSRPRASRSTCRSRPARCTRRTTSRRNGSSPTGVVSTAGGNDGVPRRSPGRSRSGIVPEGTVLTERPVGCRPGTTSEPTNSACTRARRRCSRASSRTPTRRSVGMLDRLREIGVLDNTIVMLISDNGASGEGRNPRHRERAPLHVAADRDGRGQPRAVRRVGWVPRVQPLRMGMGLGREHAVAPVEALHVARRYPRAADRALAGGHRRRSARTGAQPVLPRRRPHAHDPRRVRRRASRDRRRREPAAVRRREPASHVRRPRRRRHRARRSTSSSSGRARSCTTVGRRRPTTSRRVSPTKSDWSRAVATSRPTVGSCSGSTTTSPKQTTSPPNIPTWSVRSTHAGSKRPSAITCSRSSTRS